MPADRNVNHIRCTRLSAPSCDSAFLSITDAAGVRHRFDLTRVQLELFAAQSAEVLANWPLPCESPSKTSDNLPLVNLN